MVPKASNPQSGLLCSPSLSFWASLFILLRKNLCFAASSALPHCYYYWKLVSVMVGCGGEECSQILTEVSGLVSLCLRGVAFRSVLSLSRRRALFPSSRAITFPVYFLKAPSPVDYGFYLFMFPLGERKGLEAAVVEPVPFPQLG